IVLPRRQTMFMAVAAPGEARAALTDKKAEVLVGDHVRPCQRRSPLAIDVDHVLAAVGGKSADAVVKAQRFVRFFGGRRSVGAVRAPSDAGGCRRHDAAGAAPST